MSRNAAPGHDPHTFGALTFHDAAQRFREERDTPRPISSAAWKPLAAGSIRAATAAAEPDEEPPGVRPRSKGLVVGPGSVPPSSAVTVLPRMTAPTARSAHTAALSRRGQLPRQASQPISVGMSFVSSRSG